MNKNEDQNFSVLWAPLLSSHSKFQLCWSHKLVIPWLIWIVFFSFRAGDSYDLRKKLPFCVGLLLRLLKKNHRVFITCTSGFDRSPASVIAYLHWMTDTSLHAAYNFITSLHSSKPDRFFSIPLHSHAHNNSELPIEWNEWYSI